jgi:hypothetical protein
MTDPRFLQEGFHNKIFHVVEEAGELNIELGDLVAAAMKTMRWGPYSFNPLLPKEEQELNVDWLRRTIPEVRREIGDLLTTIQRLEEELVKL